MKKSMFVAMFASITLFSASAFADGEIVVASLDPVSIETNNLFTTTSPADAVITPDPVVLVNESELAAEETRRRELNLVFTSEEPAAERSYLDDPLAIEGQTWKKLVIDWKGEVADPKIRKDLNTGRLVFLVKKRDQGFDPSPSNDAGNEWKNIAGVFYKVNL